MYTGDDTDELSFEPGDVICVVPWSCDEEQVRKLGFQFSDVFKTCKSFFVQCMYFQDDGWLNGVKERTGEQGVFPANFTKRL